MFKRVALTFVVSLFAISIYAQDLGVDFESLKADDLSNEQIESLYARAQAQGFTIQELESMAIARGMAPAEVNKLRSRLNQIQSGGSMDDVQGTITSNEERLREGVDETEQARVSTMSVAESEKPIFGSDIFSNKNLSFEPSMNIATPRDYVLGPGDELIIDIWGAAENNYALTVTPEGVVQISNIGPIYVTGLTIDEASDLLVNKLSQIYAGLKGDRKDTFAQVSLGKVRTIKVNIVGEVRLPGTYSISSLATVFNALYVAGGPSRNGTYREIQVIRGNKVHRVVDLYDFLVFANQEDNIRLQDQDIIKIDTYKNRISLNGETKRQGLFETIEGETFADVLEYAGGFNQQAYTKRVTIRRNTDTEKQIVGIAYPEEANTVLKSGDEITVGKILDRYANRVEIQGAVYREGEYELEDNPTLHTLIQNADGLLGDAFMDRGMIFRTQPDYTVKAIPFNVGDLMNDPENNDIELIKDDIVKISSIFDLRQEYSVAISGEVNDGGSFPYFEDMTIKDLIFQASGFTESAATYNIEVARRIMDDGSGQIKNELAEIYTLEITDSLSLVKDGDEFTLQPFDQVFVRKSPTYETQRTVTITGQVLYPGTYVIENRGFKISDLVSKAGGLTEFAYPEGASLSRNFTNLETSPNFGDATLSQVGIQLEEVLRNPGSEKNLLLVEGDRLNIPIRMETVNVQGEVLFPINVRYDAGKNFKSYLNSAGGVSDEGNRNKAYIIYANGEVDRVRKFLFFKKYPDVKPGSAIYIPPKPERQRISTSERIAILSTIVSMAAIVTNTIFQIRRN